MIPIISFNHLHGPKGPPALKKYFLKKWIHNILTFIWQLYKYICFPFLNYDCVFSRAEFQRLLWAVGGSWCVNGNNCICNSFQSNFIISLI